MTDYEQMLDDMTDEDVEALRHALEKRKMSQKKGDICRKDLETIRKTFYEDERYRGRGILVDNEVKNALFALCDTVTSNYVLSTRVSLRMERHGKVWKHNSFVPKDKQVLFKQTFHELLEIVMKRKTEPIFPE